MVRGCCVEAGKSLLEQLCVFLLIVPLTCNGGWSMIEAAAVRPSAVDTELPMTLYV
jgi:hypothetical protein